jgi:GTP-binding protein Era
MSETEPTAVETEKGPTRSGFVALIGATNAGKSTLVNKLVGAKVSIVSHKVQTTRAIVRGIAIHKNAQIVFMDTPGIFKPRRRLDRAMVTTAWGGAKDADAIMMLIDSERGLKGDAETILEGLKHVEQPKMLVLNKIDQVEREDLLKLATAANEFVRFRTHLHDLGADRLRLRRRARLSRHEAAGRSVVLPGRPDFRSANAPACR